MPFPERIRRQEIEAATHCGICTDPLPPDSYKELHSETGLHLELVETAKGPGYLVHDTPIGHKALKGKILDPRICDENGIRPNDGVVLCPGCHDEIGRVARAEAGEFNDTGGNAPPPAILAEATKFFVKHGW